MGKALLVLLVLLILGGGAFYFFTRTPFEQRFAEAVQQVKDGYYDDALPVVQRAVRIYRDTPTYNTALYWYATARTALSPSSVEAWNDLLNTTAPELWHQEARYHLARVHPDPQSAKRAFIAAFPESPFAHAFFVDLAARARADNDIIAEAALLQELVDNHEKSISDDAIFDRLGELNMSLLCSPRPLPYTTHHEVKPGEFISTIASQYRSSSESIKRVNRLTTDTIRPGVRLKVDLSDYHIVVRIDDKTLTLYRLHEGQTNFVKRYPVGTGKHDNTPRGDFRVTLKQLEPVWYKPTPSGSVRIAYGHEENLLGTRWIGIDAPGFGIHGTWEPESVGQASSMGCVRMINSDVEELYDLIRVGTPVIIRD